MAHSRESKFFLSGTVSPESVFRLNLQPNKCMPRMLRGMGTERGAKDPFCHSQLSAPQHHTLCLQSGPILRLNNFSIAEKAIKGVDKGHHSAFEQ